VAIQCKHYKGLVGPQEVRALIGAMHLTQAESGLLVTTSMFSIQAEGIAKETRIETIDGNKLVKLIAEAATK
jgi:restriction endonuclease Mrr